MFAEILSHFPTFSDVPPTPRELLDITGQPLNPTTVGMRDVNDDEGCPVMSSDIVTLHRGFLELGLG